MKKVSLHFLMVLGLAAPAAPLQASETRTYTYDARGRLIAAASSGTINNGRVTTYCLDQAGNRVTVTSDTSGAQGSCASSSAGCTLRTYDRDANDEFTFTVIVEKVGTCNTSITLSYSVQWVSGAGTYNTLGWYYSGGILSPGESYQAVRFDPDEGSVAQQEPLVLRVTFSTTTPGVTISPNVSTVTIYSNS